MQFSVFFCKGKIFPTRKLKSERSGLGAMASVFCQKQQIMDSSLGINLPKKKKLGIRLCRPIISPKPCKSETLCTGYDLLEN